MPNTRIHRRFTSIGGHRRAATIRQICWSRRNSLVDRIQQIALGNLALAKLGRDFGELEAADNHAHADGGFEVFLAAFSNRD